MGKKIDEENAIFWKRFSYQFVFLYDNENNE